MLDSTYVEKVQFIGRASYAVGEQKSIPLKPRDFLGLILEACTGTAHGG